MTTSDTEFHYLRRDGRLLRGRLLPGADTLIVFLPGFRSVCTGEKATAISNFAAERGHACLRFDYLGHGESDGEFADFRISEAMHDTAACIDKAKKREQRLILVGSSMGGWIGLELVRHGHTSADGMLLIAPALEFVTRRFARLPTEHIEAFRRDGHVDLPDTYAPGETYRISNEFLVDAALCQPQPGPTPLPCPVTIIHGTDDESVPVALSRELATRIPGCRLVEVPGGDHRLSGHLPLILKETAALAARRAAP
ncbi:MAG: alpha/beta hydrolase [Leptospirillia bacterium]